MSLGNALECSSCKQHAAVVGWINLYQSFTQATMSNGPEFLSAFVPGPLPIKVEICFLCGHFGVKESTEEELKELEKYTEKSKKKREAGDNLGKLFGKFMGGKTEG